MIQSERLLNTLVNLIQIDSPSGEEDAIDDELSRRLQALGCEVLHDSYGNIVAKLPGEGDPVLVSSHMDTVDPGRGIKPSLDGDTLRADGTTILGGDCKAGLTIVLEALASIQESRVPHRPVDVVFTRHEEGGLVGVHHLDFRLVDAKMGVVFDGEGPVSRVTVAAPSQNVVKANITGRAAHAGVEPEKGLSAILIAAEIIIRLPLGRIDQETTANIGRMDAGLKRNIVPEAAFLDGEIRSLDNGKLDRVSGEFRTAFQQVEEKYPEAQISLEIENTYQAYRIEAGHAALSMIRLALGTLGAEAELMASGGGSDANVFIEKGIVALPMGIGVESFHTTRESANIPQVLQGAQFCQSLIAVA